uniref:Uncharacterized protein n=1 Tax=Biomphalaria glabrata TaxID=6526 RepID=A0A2C9M326_BIOGL
MADGPSAITLPVSHHSTSQPSLYQSAISHHSTSQPSLYQSAITLPVSHHSTSQPSAITLPTAQLFYVPVLTRHNNGSGALTVFHLQRLLGVGRATGQDLLQVPWLGHSAAPVDYVGLPVGDKSPVAQCATVCFSLSTAFKLAPLFSSSLISGMFPAITAMCNGVKPSSSAHVISDGMDRRIYSAHLVSVFSAQWFSSSIISGLTYMAPFPTVCGHAEVLDVLLENGAELDVPDKHHAFPVHYAAQMVTSSGASQMILKTLLSNSVSVEAEDKDKRTPIIWAASAGSSQACTILVEFGADVNRADKDDLTALHCASSRGQTACVETLVKNCNADLDPVDKNQCTPLFYAATLGHIECLKKLLDLGADSSRTDTRGRTVAHCAVVSGSTEALQVLSDYNIDLWTRNLKGDQPIHEAAQSGHIGITSYLSFLLPYRQLSYLV